MKENFRKNSIDFLHHALLQFQEVASQNKAISTLDIGRHIKLIGYPITRGN
nr:MAG TPA: hypothetical protein [Caudoviricetes sp.]